MTRYLKFVLFLFPFVFAGCKIYSFHSGASVEGLKTFSVPLFRDVSSLSQPNLDRDFTYLLQDYISRYTNLKVLEEDGDIVYSGEISDYKIEPSGLTGTNSAAQNRLTIEVNIKFTNNKDEEKNFERKFSHYYDYDAGLDMEGSLRDTAYEAIFDRILLDIFNASLGW